LLQVIGVRLLILVTAAWGFAQVLLISIVYEIWIGEAAKLAKAAGGNTLAAHKILCWFVLVGWATTH
jgi:hypothetical protein